MVGVDLSWPIDSTGEVAAMDNQLPKQDAGSSSDINGLIVVPCQLGSAYVLICAGRLGCSTVCSASRFLVGHGGLHE